MPPAIDWTGPGAQQRVQRLAADSLIEVTGGRAVIADELPGTTDSDVQAALRALGEDAANTLTFSITVGLGKRLITGANPIQSFTAPKRMVVDYVARIEVRHVGAPDVIGTVEAIETGAINEHGTGNTGERWAAAAAIDEAMDEAVRAFAPRHPHAAPADVDRRGPAGRRRQPDAEARDAAAAVSRAVARAGAGARRQRRALPGGRARCPRDAGGRARAICWVYPGAGPTPAARRWRASVARGGKPLVAVVRGGQRYILSM